MDILERPDACPVSPEDRDQIIEPFISAARMTLSELARTDLSIRSVYRVKDPRTLADLSAVIGLTADGGGVLVLSVPNDTATTLAGRVLAETVPAPDDDLVRDCLGELANVVAGQAKTLLADTPYQLILAIPSVLFGAGLEVGSSPGTAGLIVVFSSDAGNIALQVCLPLNQV